MAEVKTHDVTADRVNGTLGNTCISGRQVGNHAWLEELVTTNVPLTVQGLGLRLGLKTDFEGIKRVTNQCDGYPTACAGNDILRHLKPTAGCLILGAH